MLYFVVTILIGVSIITPFCRDVVSNCNALNENINNTVLEDVMQESVFKVEGTITRVTFMDTSKTIRVKRLKMHLYLNTSDSPHEDIAFFKRPVLESDKQLRVGQRVSITARKNVISESLEIIHIEPL